jgi:hypothetical protein
VVVSGHTLTRRLPNSMKLIIVVSISHAWPRRKKEEKNQFNDIHKLIVCDARTAWKKSLFFFFF